MNALCAFVHLPPRVIAYSNRAGDNTGRPEQATAAMPAPSHVIHKSPSSPLPGLKCRLSSCSPSGVYVIAHRDGERVAAGAVLATLPADQLMGARIGEEIVRRG
jgi:hypothetical protein